MRPCGCDCGMKPAPQPRHTPALPDMSRLSIGARQEAEAGPTQDWDLSTASSHDRTMNFHPFRSAYGNPPPPRRLRPPPPSSSSALTERSVPGMLSGRSESQSRGGRAEVARQSRMRPATVRVSERWVDVVAQAGTKSTENTEDLGMPPVYATHASSGDGHDPAGLL